VTETSRAAPPSDELIEVVDDADRVIEVLPRSVVRARNLRHRTAFVVVRSTNGEILAHRRAATKRVAPGLWDLGFGGGVVPGETYEEAAARELAEEAGITAPLTFLADYTYDGEDSRERGQLFETVSDGPFRHPPEEIDATAFVAPGDLDAFGVTHPLCPAAIDVMVELLRG
jgi:8-oxo-dGTP pyrophosphatase MutT (NUDIX family)